MGRLRAHFWISIGGSLIAFVLFLVLGALGYWTQAYAAAMAGLAFVAGRMLYALVDLHFVNRRLRTDDDWDALERELAELRRQRRTIMQDLLAKNRDNGGSASS